MKRIRLGIVATRPVQYTAPLFRLLAGSERVLPKAFFTWSQTAGGEFFDVEFGMNITWDVPLLEGYEYEFAANVARRPGPGHFFGIRTPSLPAAIERWRADALLVYGWNHASHLGVMRRFRGRLPIFFRGDSTLLDPAPPIRRALRQVTLRWVYRHVDFAISVGSDNRDYFQWCGIPRQRIAFAPHCVDNGWFEDPAGRHDARATAWRAQLGIEADEVVYVFAGKLIAKKDPTLLLRAFIESGAPGHLVFFGSGKLEERLRSLAAERRNVHFMPFQNQSGMPAVYRLGDVFALTSCGPGETWGLALNEAMACGRPVIASSRAGGARDLVVGGVTGWTFQAGDAAALARCLTAASKLGREGLDARGENARRHIRAWSLEASARAIEGAIVHHVDAVHS